MKGIWFIILFLTCTLPATAQRRITPIDNPSTATQHINENYNPDSLDRSKLTEMKDAQGRVILVDTVTGKEVVDSAALKVVPRMIYPLVYSASISVNIWDPVMRLLGQKYGLVEFGAEFNMHNRYIPVFEVGLGEANDTPDDNNYTYKSAFAPYFRIGMNYNFLYNSSPDYMAMAGVRYGFSPFSWSVENVTVDSPYWREDELMNIPGQKTTAGYLELLFNLRLRIKGPIYLGWTFRYHTILHETKSPHGQPWYIPGFGSRNSAVSGAFNITYTFDLHKRRKHSHFGETQPENNEYETPPIYPDDLPELPDDGDPTVTPHYHPE